MNVDQCSVFAAGLSVSSVLSVVPYFVVQPCSVLTKMLFGGGFVACLPRIWHNGLTMPNQGPRHDG